MTRTSTSDYNSKIDFSKLNLSIDDIPVYNGISFIAKNNFNNVVWWYFVKSDLLKNAGLVFED